LSPAATTIKKGTAVTWTNKDTGNHAIAQDDQNGQAFHSPELKSGESYTYTFSTAGTYSYKDVINPALTGTITVTQ
jgi:plastocyanin